jgi:hypothetical protein
VLPLSLPLPLCRHAYIFPCIASSAYSTEHAVACSSPASQMKQTIDFLESSGVRVRRSRGGEEGGDGVAPSVRRIWLDIEDEDPSIYYDTDVTVNQAAIDELIATAEAEGVYVGIYTTKTYWTKIMGGVEGYSQYPLWYPRYDGENSMDFFETFAGWESVYIKQTAGDAGMRLWMCFDFFCVHIYLIVAFAVLSIPIALCDISQVDTDYMEIVQ